MLLESAIGLKQQLLSDLVNPFAAIASGQTVSPAHASKLKAAGGLVVANALAVGAKPFDALPAVQRSIALGVARHQNTYRLAIRVQRQQLLKSPLVDKLVAEAKGEADVRLIGRIDKRGGSRRASLPAPAAVRTRRVSSGSRQRMIAVAAAVAPWFRQNQRPLLIGASVGHVDVTAGTIGAFVTRGGKRCLLSNNHVLANEDLANPGDTIIQRGAFDGGKPASDAIGTLLTAVRLKPGGANFVDAAVAEIDEDIDFDINRLRELIGGADRRLAGLGPEFLDEGQVVHKVGRTTGPTTGRVTAFDIDNVVVNYDIGNLRFDSQIEIEGTEDKAFSDGGDSGSLIVNGDMLAVALLFAGGDSGGSNGLGLTYANPIHRVLKDLKATLLF
jgi:hypothetical protein